MKGSLVTSTTLHALILGFALSSFSAPRTLEVTDVESLPVDIVPVESITQIQQGDKKAPMTEKAAPVPTKRPDPVQDAQNAGENEVDLKPAEAKPSPREIVSEAPPKAADKPVPTPEPKPEPVEAAKAEPAPQPKPEPVKKPEPAPKPVAVPEPAPAEAPTEVAALPADPQDAVAEQIEQAPQEPEFKPLPTAGPVPQKRPKPDAPRPAATSSKQSDFNADEVAALLNKQDAAGGGAKRSTETASLGGSKTTTGNTLSQSEMDALRGQIERNLTFIAGKADNSDVRVTVKMRLDRSGYIVGNPEVTATGSERAYFMGRARVAVMKAQPYQLPAEKYDSWSDVIVNIEPSQIQF